MDLLIEIILKAGRSAVELSLFVLLPVMVVMLPLRRLLEARGVLDRGVVRLAPLLKPFDLARWRLAPASALLRTLGHAYAS